MKKTLELDIVKLSHEGRGIAYHDNQPVFVTGALANERVKCQLLRKQKNVFEAVAIEIENKHPDRITPKCDHYLSCGGCTLQHLDHKKQLALKEQTLFAHLDHYLESKSIQKLAATDSPPWHYRKKARLGVKYVKKKEKVLIGFRELINPRFITDLTACPILDESIGMQLPKLANLIESLSQKEQIPQIEIAVADEGTALIIRHLLPFDHNDFKQLEDFQSETCFLIFLQSKGPDTIKGLNELTPTKLSYTLPEYQLRLEFLPHHFTQINQSINQSLIQSAINLLAIQPNDRVLDLFCGLGNFSLVIARYAKQVVGIEGSQEMTDFAKANATLNQLPNTTFYAYDLTQPLDNLPWLQNHYDKLLLDPPRSGALAICEQIKKIKPSLIVYISCNSITFARDASILINNGYKITHAGVFNMFPHTAHIESIALFKLK